MHALAWSFALGLGLFPCWPDQVVGKNIRKDGAELSKGARASHF